VRRSALELAEQNALQIAASRLCLCGLRATVRRLGNGGVAKSKLLLSLHLRVVVAPEGDSKPLAFWHTPSRPEQPR